MSNLKKLYDDVFFHLDGAKRCEELKDFRGAASGYENTVRILNAIKQFETDPRKLALVNANLKEYQDKLASFSRRQSLSAPGPPLNAPPLKLPMAPTSIPGPTPAPTANVAPASVAKTLGGGRGQVPETTRQGDKFYQHAQDLEKREPVNVSACIDNYVKAAELYMKDESMKRRIVEILDKVESLKLSTFTDSSALESLLPQAPSFVESTSSTAPTLKPTAQTAASGTAKWVGAAKKKSDAPLPLSDAESCKGLGLTATEIAVLRASSVINGRLYQPWLMGEEERERFRFDHPYCDPDGLLPLSRQQTDKGVEWKRPREFVPEGSTPSVIESISPMSIRQDLVSDCSFVCSLCIAAAFEMRFKKQLITGILFPQNSARKPVYNPFGKYLVKLFINGVQRKVVIDDRLPVVAGSNRLLCSSTTDPRELWVSLIEKAYMKVNGGYDFPGSNSGIDLYALTGWIPEHVFFSEDDERLRRGLKATHLTENGEEMQDHRQGEDRAWERIKSAFGFGDCLITIATGSLTEEDETTTGLVPGHAYAVLEVREAGILRMMKVKNPWSRRPWKGRFSSNDRERWTQGLKKALGIKNEEEFDSMETHGIFWIEFSDCRRYFKSFFLNWNPALFSFRSTYHDFWPAALGPQNDKYFIGENPQYSLVVDHTQATAKAGVSPSNHSIWILVSRHVVNQENQERSTIGEDDNSVRDEREGDFLACHVYSTPKSGRMYLNSNPAINGLYTNDPHTLIRVDINDLRSGESEGNEQCFSLVMSQINKHRDVSYTLSILGTIPFRFSPSPQPPPHKFVIPGAWGVQPLTSGGAPSHASFYLNPQFSLVLTSPAQVHMEVLHPKEVSSAIFVCKGGNRFDCIPEAAEVMSSGSYRPGYSYCEGSFEPGAYTVILSNYNPTMTGKFRFTLRSSVPRVGLTEIQPEGQLGYRQTIRDKWSVAEGTAAGCSNHGGYHRNPFYCFEVTSAMIPIRCTLRLQCPSTSSNAINVSLFNLSTMQAGSGSGTGLPYNTNPKKAAFTSNNGVYSDKVTGVLIDNAELTVGVWAAVVSTFDPVDCGFNLMISFSTKQTVDISRIQ